MNNFIKKVLVSEKSYQNAATGKFTFVVDKHASKDAIANMVSKLFKVTVLSANSMNYKGKIKMTKRNKGKRNDFKKVILTLKPGEKIDLFELEAADEKKEQKKSENKNLDKPEIKKSEKTLVNKAVKKVETKNRTMEG